MSARLLVLNADQELCSQIARLRHESGLYRDLGRSWRIVRDYKAAARNDLRADRLEREADRLQVERRAWA